MTKVPIHDIETAPEAVSHWPGKLRARPASEAEPHSSWWPPPSGSSGRVEHC
jgi:hypothetical protein